MTKPGNGLSHTEPVSFDSRGSGSSRKCRRFKAGPGWAMILIIPWLMLASGAMAGEISIAGLTAAEYHSLAGELGSVLSRRQLGAAEKSGLLGFEFKGAASMTRADATAAWDKAITGGGPSTLTAPQISFTKGFPFNLDLEVRAGKVLDTGLEFKGFMAKYTFLEGTFITPAFSVSAAYTTVDGAKDFDAGVMDLTASVSKGLGPLTPYGGLTWSRISIEPGTAALGHVNMDRTQLVKFAGFRFSFLPLAWVNIEYAAGEVSSVSASFSLGF